VDKLTYFILTRKIFESSIWRDDPHILKLFIYLVGTARHSKEPKKYNNFQIKRGELVTSLSIIAENNEFIKNGRLQQWSRAKVSRMLSVLQEQEYIKLISDTYGTHISICKYNTYQDPNTYKSDTTETILKRFCNDTETVLDTNNNVKKDKKEKNNISFLLPIELEGKITQDLWTDWIEYREEIKKPLTEISIKKQVGFLIQQPDPSECINSAIRNHWQGLFEVKSSNGSKIVKAGSQITAVEFPGGDAFGEFAK
jgi:ribosomal protein S24E